MRRLVLPPTVLLVLAALAQPAVVGAEKPGDDPLNYLPDNSQIVVSLKVAECLKSGVWKDLRKEISEIEDAKKAFREATTLTPDQVERVVVAFRTDRPPFIVARTTKELKVTDVKAALKNPRFKESKIGGETLYENQTDANASFVLIGGTTVLYGPADQLRAALGRRGPPKHTPGLQAALAKTDLKQTCFCAGDIKILNEKGGLGLDGNYLDTVVGCVLSAQPGDDLTLRCTVVCKDAETAEDARKLLDGCVVVCKYFVKNQKDLPKGFPATETVDVLRKVKVTSDDTSATVTGTIPSAVLTKGLRSLLPKPSP